ncbi:MAG TPA: hypothetical protein VKS24_18905 [Bradyrhizobium sp.]|nr:hypothetical protein [Bradyrhizobium sp.]
MFFFGGVTGGFCFAVAPVELGVIAPAFDPAVGVPMTELCLVTPPTVLGLATTEVGLGVVAPPTAGAGLAAPPTVFIFVFAGPPMALWAEAESETPTASAPSTKAATIVLFFMDVVLA